MPAISDPKYSFLMSSEIVDNALLLATLPDLTAPHFLAPVITHAVQYTRNRLIIVLFSRYFNVCPQAAEIRRSESGRPSPTFAQKQGLSHTSSWDAVQRILTFTYVQATKIAWELNKVPMEVDVLLKGFNEDLTEDIGTGVGIVFRVKGDTIHTPLPQSIFTLREMFLEPGDQISDLHADTASGVSDHATTLLPSCYPVTALGGTFDHLHAGHKILLSMGAYITNQKLIVGVTDDALLQNKSNKHVLEKLSTRIQRVRDFLMFFKPEITPEIVPITDVYGPTGWDPDVQALVVSKETLSGGDAIARHRAAHNLPPLQPFLIDVISATETSLDHDDVELLKTHKLSSTYIRQWIVDNSKQEEEEEEEVNPPSTEN